MTTVAPIGTKVAYKDEQFLDSEEARPLRILAEYLEPLQAFRREHVSDTIVFFGSARLVEHGPLGHYYADARELARLVTAWSLCLPAAPARYVVCSGGGGGIMANIRPSCPPPRTPMVDPGPMMRVTEARRGRPRRA